MSDSIRIAILALLFFTGLCTGWVVNGWRMGAQIDELKLTMETQAETARLAAQSAINSVTAKAAVKARKEKATEAALNRRVENVPTDLPLLPPAFRVLHDAAATGKAPDDSAASHADPVAPRTLAATLAGNYSAARENARTLEELQAIVAASGCFDLAPE
jgi:hypothetical protein